MITSIFSSEQLKSIDPALIPKHVAIIPDGNRRWAKKQMEQPISGHRSGANVLIDIVKAARELGVKAITFYMFSTENWSRAREEIDALMWLLQEFLRENLAEMLEYGVRIQTIGDLTGLPSDAYEVVEETRKATQHCKDIDMVMALNYGSRDEMRRAIHRIVNDCQNNIIQKDDINEALISEYLDTAPWGDPDLYIRTSGELRVSNFLLWQISYSEIYITDILWPDFTPHELLNAVKEFQKRTRRLGGA